MASLVCLWATVIPLANEFPPVVPSCMLHGCVTQNKHAKANQAERRRWLRCSQCNYMPWLHHKNLIYWLFLQFQTHSGSPLKALGFKAASHHLHARPLSVRGFCQSPPLHDSEEPLLVLTPRALCYRAAQPTCN